jgi:regulator of protease activity HflC (stomatin/prohibitin superfamily)
MRKPVKKETKVSRSSGIGGILGLIVAFMGVLVALTIFLGTWYKVNEYERVVLTRWGSFVSVEGPGIHFKMPFVNDIEYFQVNQQQLTPKQKENTYTEDNQEVDVLYKVLYRIPEDKVEFVYREVRDYKYKLEALVVDRLKTEMGKMNINTVAKNRGKLTANVGKTLKVDALEQLGIQVIDFQVPELEYTKNYRAAIEKAAEAKAIVEQRQQEWEQAKFTAETAREVARGAADAVVINAKAEAERVELNGKAHAAAIEAQAKALAQNSNLVELRKSERWDGKLPATMLSNVVPFMGVDQTGVVSAKTSNISIDPKLGKARNDYRDIAKK